MPPSPAVPPPVAVLIVRAWIEPHPTAPLRAMIAHIDPTTGRADREHAVKSVDELCDAVRTWVETLGAAVRPPPQLGHWPL